MPPHTKNCCWSKVFLECEVLLTLCEEIHSDLFRTDYCHINLCEGKMHLKYMCDHL